MPITRRVRRGMVWRNCPDCTMGKSERWFYSIGDCQMRPPRRRGSSISQPVSHRAADEGRGGNTYQLLNMLMLVCPLAQSGGCSPKQLSCFIFRGPLTFKISGLNPVGFALPPPPCLPLSLRPPPIRQCAGPSVCPIRGRRLSINI